MLGRTGSLRPLSDPITLTSSTVRLTAPGRTRGLRPLSNPTIPQIINRPLDRALLDRRFKVFIRPNFSSPPDTRPIVTLNHPDHPALPIDRPARPTIIPIDPTHFQSPFCTFSSLILRRLFYFDQDLCQAAIQLLKHYNYIFLAL